MKFKKYIITFILFLTFQFTFLCITLPFYTMYGPFKKVRNQIVELSMSSGNHQYIAKLFFGSKKIKQILADDNKNINSSKPAKETDKVKIKYTEDNVVRINITNDKFNGIALVIKDPLKVKVGFSSKLNKVGETVSDMSLRYNALAAVNGGGYYDVSPNGRTGGTGGIPTGIIISDGKVIYPTDTKKYSSIEGCAFSIDNSGRMYVGPASVNTLLDKHAECALSFSPSLIIDGKPFISDYSLNAMAPRTAIGQRSDNSIILLAIDGRNSFKFGATLQDVQNVMLKLGAVNAMCLDGGGSTAMYYNGEIINNPSCVTGERPVPDIIYVEH